MGVRIGRESSEEFKRSGKDKPDANGVYENEFGVKYRARQVPFREYAWFWLYHPLQDKEPVDEYDFPEIDFATQFTKAEENVKKMEIDTLSWGT